MVIVFNSQAAFEAIRDAVNAESPEVAIGEPAIAADGRRSVSYAVPWSDSLKIKAARIALDLNAELTYSDQMPGDWISAGATE